MKHENLYLKEFFPILKTTGSDAVLCTYLHNNSPLIDDDMIRPAIVICPGGGYRFTSDREAEPVAIRFLNAGYQVFVLRYSCGTSHYPAQLLELSATVALVRKNAVQWHVNSEKIAVCGFSAGGHLAASFANFWSEDFIARELGIAANQNKPNAVILSYPVISSGEFAHHGSFEYLLGENSTVEDQKKLSLEFSVNEKNPPAFLWHTVTDASVPVQNSLLYANALLEKHIPFEMHLYPQGVHGLSLADESTAAKGNAAHVNPHVAAWFETAVKWLAVTL